MAVRRPSKQGHYVVGSTNTSTKGSTNTLEKALHVVKSGFSVGDVEKVPSVPKSTVGRIFYVFQEKKDGGNVHGQARIQRGDLGIYPPSIFWK